MIEDKDLGLEKILHEFDKLAAKEVAVGVLGEAALTKHENLPGDGESDSEATLVDIAVWNEFGTDDGHIPERGAHRSAFEKNKKELEHRMEMTAEAVKLGNMDAKRGHDLLGIWYADQVKDEIREFDDPPNAEFTQLKKGRPLGKGVMVDNPLVDTGRYINSITHEIRDYKEGLKYNR